MNNNVAINGKVIGLDGKKVPARSIAQPHPTMAEPEPVVAQTPAKEEEKELLKKNAKAGWVKPPTKVDENKDEDKN